MATANGDRDEVVRPPKGVPVPFASRAILEATPTIAAVVLMLSLIFGGCCSNVYALEAIIKFEPASGTLLTFVQFLFVAITGYVAHFDSKRPPLFISRNQVPLRRWLVIIVLFFSINILNNHAFGYNISVPVHIILRSGGSITTMSAGYIYGKRYPRIQVLAVLLLSLGVILAAWSDANEKAKPRNSSNSAPGTGLAILFAAQLLSAIMGLYTEATYREYGPHWKENLFYSHILSLPLFLPFVPSMVRDFNSLARSAPLQLPTSIFAGWAVVEVPIQLVYLAANVLTQYLCIRGVNLLAATSSALTVTIVLNIRKLVSLLLSIWLFGNSLPLGTIIGAAVVFGAGGLYSLGSKRKSGDIKSSANAAKKNA